MRKTNRLPQPENLKKYSAQWTKELLDEIDRYIIIYNSIHFSAILLLFKLSQTFIAFLP